MIAHSLERVPGGTKENNPLAIYVYLTRIAISSYCIYNNNMQVGIKEPVFGMADRQREVLGNENEYSVESRCIIQMNIWTERYLSWHFDLRFATRCSIPIVDKCTRRIMLTLLIFREAVVHFTYWPSIFLLRTTCPRLLFPSPFRSWTICHAKREEPR